MRPASAIGHVIGGLGLIGLGAWLIGLGRIQQVPPDALFLIVFGAGMAGAGVLLATLGVIALVRGLRSIPAGDTRPGPGTRGGPR